MENLLTNCPVVSETELLGAVSRIQPATAPGPDGITPEHARAAIIEHKQLFRDLYSTCLRLGYFPEEWKLSGLVLIDKPSADNPKKYRPICLLDMFGKVFESIINKRLKEEIKRIGWFNDNQFGFRAGKSTMDAIEKIVAKARSDQVKNAFNTTNWNLILRKARRRGIDQVLLKALPPISLTEKLYWNLEASSKCAPESLRDRCLGRLSGTCCTMT